MKALILAAGFGTRLEKGLKEYQGINRKLLEEWIKDKPKGLVPVSGKPIVSHQLEQLTEAGIERKDVYIHTNQLHYGQFLRWAAENGIPSKNVFNNGVVRNEDRKEQVQDLLLALEKIGYDKLLFLFASDTLVYDKDGRLLDMVLLSKEYLDGFSVAVAYNKNENASKHGVFSINDKNVVVGFREKPEGVKSGLVNASVYLFSPSKLQEMAIHSKELLGYKNILELLWNGFKVVEASKRLDIGTIEDVLKANGLL